MYQVHGFACVKVMRPHCFTSQLARIQRTHATALKPPHEAGGRGGESTARWRWCGFYFFSV
ncbi:hypothetical protein NGF48_01545 [Escherichia coli]|nr:hypothetical protein [Escherichia coli]MDO2616095.1 hypothetical protein [Escherichia coli]MEB8296682.1 hypothetical protein [Escherichia coli]HAJ0253298.1 hypothetical protein [Escherichia coli]